MAMAKDSAPLRRESAADSTGESTGPRFLSVRQAAEYLQVNEKKIYALASEGKIPGTKITGKWLFPASSWISGCWSRATAACSSIA